MGQSFEEYWQECLSLARIQGRLGTMIRLKSLYYIYWMEDQYDTKDTWEEGVSAEEIVESEWG